jgi:putative ubiquitin-RnfH superfamily antitoxin RatB of RatAB toxin-antitoxin module
MTKALITVNLVFSPAPRKIDEKTLALPPGSTVLEALLQAGWVNEALEAGHTVGIWGKKTSPSHLLQDRDRIEIYRPLKVDPKVARRERFQKQGARTTGLFAKTRSGGKAGY